MKTCPHERLLIEVKCDEAGNQLDLEFIEHTGIYVLDPNFTEVKTVSTHIENQTQENKVTQCRYIPFMFNDIPQWKSTYKKQATYFEDIQDPDFLKEILENIPHSTFPTKNYHPVQNPFFQIDLFWLKDSVATLNMKVFSTGLEFLLPMAEIIETKSDLEFAQASSMMRNKILLSEDINLAQLNSIDQIQIRNNRAEMPESFFSEKNLFSGIQKVYSIDKPTEKDYVITGKNCSFNAIPTNLDTAP